MLEKNLINISLELQSPIEKIERERESDKQNFRHVVLDNIGKRF